MTNINSNKDNIESNNVTINNLSYTVFNREQCKHICSVINTFSVRAHINNVLDVRHEVIHQKLMQMTIDKNRNVDTVQSTTPYKIVDIEGRYGLIVDNVIVIAKPHSVEWGGILNDEGEVLWTDTSFETMAHFIMGQIASK